MKRSDVVLWQGKVGLFDILPTNWWRIFSRQSGLVAGLSTSHSTASPIGSPLAPFWLPFGYPLNQKRLYG